jgi:hypothetical protein
MAQELERTLGTPYRNGVIVRCGQPMEGPVGRITGMMDMVDDQPPATRCVPRTVTGNG